MTEEYRRDEEVTRSSSGGPVDPDQDEVVSTTDPVTGQVVNVNRTTGQVVTGPGITETVYRRSTTGNASPAVQGPTMQGPAMSQQQVRHVVDDPYATRRQQVYKIEQVIYLIFGIIEGLIAIRFVLRLLAANPNAGFAAFIYDVTSPFIAPFYGLFGVPTYRGAAFEVHSLVAIVIYALIAWLLARIVWLAAGETRSSTRSSSEYIDRNIR